MQARDASAAWIPTLQHCGHLVLTLQPSIVRPSTTEKETCKGYPRGYLTYLTYSEVRGACVAQAMDSLMPGFDKEIARLAQRTLIAPRKIDFHTGVLATKVTPGAPP